MNLSKISLISTNPSKLPGRGSGDVVYAFLVRALFQAFRKTIQVRYRSSKYAGNTATSIAREVRIPRLPARAACELVENQAERAMVTTQAQRAANEHMAVRRLRDSNSFLPGAGLVDVDVVLIACVIIGVKRIV
jgi:hypothetical protein